MENEDLRAIPDALRAIIREIGDDPEREGLLDTPKRVMKSWKTLYGGYGQDPMEVLTTSFDPDGYDQMVMLGPIEFWSTCEHHMLTFFGEVHVGYIPGEEGRVIGISKLARAVDIFARRLQIQERMTKQIAEAVEKAVGAKGVAVVVRAKHLCMVARGVQKQQSRMTTSAMLGAFRDNIETRTEFLRLMEGTS